MDSFEFAENHYLQAKAEWKNDIKIFVVFSIAGFIMSFLFFVFMIVCVDPIFESIIFSVLLSLIMAVATGIYLAFCVFGIVIIFKFVWEHLSGLSILLFLLVLCFAMSFGYIATLIKLIKGYANIRALRKKLYSK